jgi:hypothetical protein
MSLENMSVDARGLFSEALQQGYALGYLTAAIMNIAVILTSSEGYKAIFCIDTGLTALVAITVMFIPDSHIYQAKKDEEQVRFGRRVSNFLADLRLANLILPSSCMHMFSSTLNSACRAVPSLSSSFAQLVGDIKCVDRARCSECTRTCISPGGRNILG